MKLFRQLTWSLLSPEAKLKDGEKNSSSLGFCDCIDAVAPETLSAVILEARRLRMGLDVSSAEQQESER